MKQFILIGAALIFLESTSAIKGTRLPKRYLPTMSKPKPAIRPSWKELYDYYIQQRIPPFSYNRDFFPKTPDIYIPYQNPVVFDSIPIKFSKNQHGRIEKGSLGNYDPDQGSNNFQTVRLTETFQRSAEFLHPKGKPVDEYIESFYSRCRLEEPLSRWLNCWKRLLKGDGQAPEFTPIRVPLDGRRSLRSRSSANSRSEHGRSDRMHLPARIEGWANRSSEMPVFMSKNLRR